MKMTKYSLILALVLATSLIFSSTPATAGVVLVPAPFFSLPIFQQTSSRSLPVGNTQARLFDATGDSKTINRSGSLLGELFNDKGNVLRLYPNAVTNSGKTIDAIFAVSADIKEGELTPQKDKKSGKWVYPTNDHIALLFTDQPRAYAEINLETLQPGSYQIVFYGFMAKGIRDAKVIDLTWFFGILPKISFVNYSSSKDLLDVVQFTVAKRPICTAQPTETIIVSEIKTGVQSPNSATNNQVIADQQNVTKCQPGPCETVNMSDPRVECLGHQINAQRINFQNQINDLGTKMNCGMTSVIGGLNAFQAQTTENLNALGAAVNTNVEAVKTLDRNIQATTAKVDALSKDNAQLHADQSKLQVQINDLGAKTNNSFAAVVDAFNVSQKQSTESLNKLGTAINTNADAQKKTDQAIKETDCKVSALLQDNMANKADIQNLKIWVDKAISQSSSACHKDSSLVAPDPCRYSFKVVFVRGHGEAKVVKSLDGYVVFNDIVVRCGGKPRTNTNTEGNLQSGVAEYDNVAEKSFDLHWIICKACRKQCGRWVVPEDVFQNCEDETFWNQVCVEPEKVSQNGGILVVPVCEGGAR